MAISDRFHAASHSFNLFNYTDILLPDFTHELQAGLRNNGPVAHNTRHLQARGVGHWQIAGTSQSCFSISM